MEEVEVWLARNSNGNLLFYSQKPIKDEDYGEWSGINDCDFICLMDFEDSFPSIKWEDKEPTKAKIVLNKED